MNSLNFCLILVYLLSQTEELTFFKNPQLDHNPWKKSFPFRSQSFLSQEEQTEPEHIPTLTNSFPLNDSFLEPTLKNKQPIIDPLPSFKSFDKDLEKETNVNNTQCIVSECEPNKLPTTQSVASVDDTEKSIDVIAQEVVTLPALTNKTSSVTDHDTKDIVLLNEPSPSMKISNPFEQKNKIIDRITLDSTPATYDDSRKTSITEKTITERKSSNTGPLVIDKKHSLTDAIRNQFVSFQPYDSTQELCFDVFTDLRQHPLFSSNAYLLFNILVSLDIASHGKPGQAIQEDKNVFVSMEELHHKNFLTLLRNVPCQSNGKVASNPSSCFHDRLSKCVTDHKHGRTLYQTIISLGFEKSYQSFFVKSSLGEKTSSNYNPLLSLDKEGNTLLHLAAGSGSTTILKDLLDRVASPATSWNSEPNVAEKGYYYILNAMNLPNHQKLLPLDLAKTSSVRLRLKRTYRTVIQFVRTLIAEDV